MSAVIRCVVVATLACSVLLLAGCDPLDKNELRREVETIQSISAEGSLLAQQAAMNRTKLTYLRVHSQELADEAEETAEKLKDAEVQQSIKPQLGEAVNLAMEESDALGQLEVSGGDEPQARAAEAALDKVTDRTKQLTDQL
jgi:hypothetical protein